VSIFPRECRLLGTFETCRLTLRMSVNGGKTGSDKPTVKPALMTSTGTLPARAARPLGSDVPYQSLVELRAAYMPDAARAVSGIPRADPGGSPPVFDIASSAFDTSAAVRLRSPLSTVPAGISSRRFRNAHHHGF
jgi:hypothetical protein